ncbi:MAG: undecaprenyldiphospho-muramoylpentapeptide beta-N-acetylglucosaminyltransferase [Bacteroidales bacterium]|nr:undecaprenyldiphospho-muramoylpentapeptide beta-N-acetylglucosaminyltransferase [Bacteroidales bacterium]
MKNNKNIRAIISGGGTGGHIFPALAIADEIKRRLPDAEILFAGANNRMEMERVPAAGYKIVGLPVRGLIRRFTLENIRVLLDFLKSQKMARKIVRDFKPDVAVGVGGYASAPVLRAASRMGVPCLLQEQNSYAGLTNKMLAKKVSKICVAYNNMERYFPAGKIVNLGNPVRKIEISPELHAEARRHFGIKSENPVLFVMGGSLGARTINRAVLSKIEKVAHAGIELLWQTGKYYYNDILEQLEGKVPENVHVLDFVSRMDLAYNLSDLIISRAGALSLSEICVVGKPSVLVPSPNVAEDHQAKNALALSNAGAAVTINDSDAGNRLIDEALTLLADKIKLKTLGENAQKLAKPNATEHIVDEIFKLIS